MQQARVLLRGLGSEIVIRLDSMPLETYPAAIAAVAPLIDQGKTNDAKAALQAAPTTLVVTEHIIPLPLVSAEANITKAEALAQKDTRAEEDNKDLGELLNAARDQLKLSELLGYGTKDEYKKFQAEIDGIEEKTKGGQSVQGLFGSLKEYVSNLRRSIFK